MKLDDLHEHLRIFSKLVLATELYIKRLVYIAQDSSEVAYLLFFSYQIVLQWRFTATFFIIINIVNGTGGY